MLVMVVEQRVLEEERERKGRVKSKRKRYYR
jgi:hypothetical protein